MRYIQLHHGSYWFQMRVPRAQRAQHGPVVRSNLQTTDRDVARVLGTTLAARWLARFSALDMVGSAQLSSPFSFDPMPTPQAADAVPSLTALPPPHVAASAPADVGGPSDPPGVDVAPHERLAALHEYLWEEVWARESWLDILHRYLMGRRDDKKQLKAVIFPRYHQLDATRKLVADVLAQGPGQRYLIQHSAGSGKTNSIAWTAHFLADLHDVH